jgi:predicted GIY-YIG superfamily endonuclease
MKRTVYLIQSVRSAERHYVGVTSNLATRLAAHNAGESPHTREHAPWQLIVALAFSSELSALRFEKYLKTGSGRAFMERYFLADSH